MWHQVDYNKNGQNRYNLNPYRGCQFACNYCDAITEKYLVHKDYKDFSRIIYVRKNAPVESWEKRSKSGSQTWSLCLELPILISQQRKIMS